MRGDITHRQVLSYVRGLGLTVSCSSGEYRIAPRGADEEMAYYTHDREDAMLTARHVADEQKVRVGA